jgi:hypothetical protein
LRFGTAGSPVAADPRRELVGGINREVHRGLDAESGIARTQRPRERHRGRVQLSSSARHSANFRRSPVGKLRLPSEAGEQRVAERTHERATPTAVSPSFAGGVEIPVVGHTDREIGTRPRLVELRAQHTQLELPDARERDVGLARVRAVGLTPERDRKLGHSGVGL